MGLSHSVEGARYFAERTFQFVRIPKYPDLFRSLRSGYVEHGTRIALGVAVFLAPLDSPSPATAFSSNSGPEDQRNSITLTNVKKQEIPPPAPGEVNPPFDLPPNMTRLVVPPLLVYADGKQLQPKVNTQEIPVTEDAGMEPPAPPTELEPEPKKDNNQEVPPPPEGVPANPPSVLNLGPNESRVLPLTTDAEGNPIPKPPAGGETVANPVQQEYRGQKGVIVIKNRVTETGQVDVPRSITVDQDKLNQMEALLASKGLKGYSLDFKSFNYDETYLIFRTQSTPEIQIGSMSICPTNKDPRCGVKFINSLRRPDKEMKKTSVTIDVLDENAKLRQTDINYLNEAFNENVTDYAMEAVYGTRIAVITDPNIKKEAEMLAAEIAGIGAFKFNFTPVD